MNLRHGINALVAVVVWCICCSQSLSGQCVTTYPYVQDFEAGPAGWFSGGVNNDWALGTPVKARINAAGSGSSCWITGGLSGGSYAGGQRSWLQSPCFDLSSLSKPGLEFLIFWDTEKQYDGGNLQYSLNNGSTWQNLGVFTTTPDCYTANWFNTPSINNIGGLASPAHGWSGTTLPSAGNCLGGDGSGAWVKAKFCLSGLIGSDSVIFRFTFGSGTSCNGFDGIAIDSFCVREIEIPDLDFSFSCEGERTLRFTGTGGNCPTAYTWDFGDPASGSNSANQPLTVHTFSAPGTYIVRYSLTEPCTGVITRERRISIGDAAATVYPVTCADSANGAIAVSTTFMANPVFTWNLQPPLSTDSITGLLPGTYQVLINGDSACPINLSVEVGLGPDANPRPELPDRVLYCNGDALTLSPGEFAAYHWSDGSTSPEFTVSDTGLVQVTVTNVSGCTASASSLVVLNCFTELWMPSAFSPNSDNLNDLFGPVSGVPEIFSMELYNRFGQKVFSTLKFGEKWDGTLDSQPCPAGIYTYVARYRPFGSKEKVIRGRFSLIR